MKRFILFIAAVFFAVGAVEAQTISVYSPNGASKLCHTFNEAYTVANDGDIIQLPAGYFKLDSIINKKLHIIGVGYNDAIRGAKGVTRVEKIELDTNSSGGSLQGLECNEIYSRAHGNTYAGERSGVQDYLIKRCKLQYVNTEGYKFQKSSNVCLQECLVVPGNDQFVLIALWENSKIENCILYAKGKIHNGYHSIRTDFYIESGIVSNCIIMNIDTTTNAEDRILPEICHNHPNLTFENNIFVGSVDGDNSKFVNNIFTGELKLRDDNVYGKDLNNKYMKAAEAFLGYKDNEDFNIFTTDFHLTDKAKNAIKPADGTEVGIYGGAYPFKILPVIPHIHKAKINTKTNAKGQLKVEFEVEAQQN